MKIINNTNSPIHWNTSQPGGGGDCGDIPPGGVAPYPISAGTTVGVSISIPSGVSYDDVGDGALVIISSRVEVGGAPQSA